MSSTVVFCFVYLTGKLACAHWLVLKCLSQPQQVVSLVRRVIRRKCGSEHTVLWAGEVRECGRC